MPSNQIYIVFFLQIFHDVAYKARDRMDLLSGIDEFLDCVTVLPPGEWDPTIRIEPPKSVPSQVYPHLTVITNLGIIMVQRCHRYRLASQGIVYI